MERVTGALSNGARKMGEFSILSRTELREAQTRLGIAFRDPTWLERAFVHRSYLNEVRYPGLRSNERLEFLGDAALELTVTDYLFRKYPDAEEGLLTAYRSALVNSRSLGTLAEELALGQYLRMSRGERVSFERGERSKLRIMANTFEAVIGAVYSDRGQGLVDVFVGAVLLPKLERIVAEKLYLDAKSHLQERMQEGGGLTPRYEVLSEQGPDHDKRFVVAVFVGERCLAEGEGFSKSEAEMSAARNALFNEFQVTLEA